MANITPGLPPQHYIGAIDTTWSFSADVDTVAYSINGLPPAISKYIAYDTLNPPTPFIAVTQDGKGNVVYDGGFPKFYNTQWNNAASFATMPPQFKYLYNAINFCANALKVTSGNRKVLFIGDATATQSYAVNNTTGSGFKNSILGFCAAANWIPTLRDPGDYASGLDTRFTEMDEYVAVVFFSAIPTVRITDNCVADLVTYREQGNGIIVITDDGPNITDISQAYPNPASRQFFASANKLVRNFGAYFTGLYDRSPVNVGFLRSTYGDHPLYNGLLDSESIAAGGSESKVVVQTFQQYAPGAIPTIPLNTPGEHTVSFLLVLKDGSIESYKFKYTVVDGEFLFACNSEGVSLQGFHDTVKRVWDGDLKTIEVNPPTMLGTINRNDIKMGEFTFDGVATTYKYLAGPTGFTFSPGDAITHLVTAPYQYRISCMVRNNFIVGGRCSQATVRRQLAVNEYAGLTSEQAYAKIEALTERWYNDTPRSLRLHPVLSGSVIRMLSGGPTGAARIPVYATTAALQAALPSITDRSLMLLDASTAATWWYANGAWSPTGQPLATMLGINRRVISTLGNGTWVVNSSTTVAKIA